MSFFADAFARFGCSGANLAKDARKHRHPPNAAQKTHVSPEVCFCSGDACSVVGLFLSEKIMFCPDYSCGGAWVSGVSAGCASGAMRAGSMAGASGFGAGLELAEGGRVSLPFEVSVYVTKPESSISA